MAARICSADDLLVSIRQHEEESDNNGLSDKTSMLYIFVANDADALIAGYMLNDKFSGGPYVVVTRVTDGWQCLMDEIKTERLEQWTSISVIGVMLIGLGGSVFTPLQFYKTLENTFARCYNGGPRFVAVFDYFRPPHPIAFQHELYGRWWCVVDSTVRLGGGTELDNAMEEMHVITAEEFERRPLPDPVIGLPLSFTVGHLYRKQQKDEDRPMHWLSSVGVYCHLQLNYIHIAEYAVLLDEIESVCRTTSANSRYGSRVSRVSILELPWIYAPDWCLRRALSHSKTLFSRGFNLAADTSRYASEQIATLREMCRITKEEFDEAACKLGQARLEHIMKNIVHYASAVRGGGGSFEVDIMRMIVGRCEVHANSLHATKALAMVAQSYSDGSSWRNLLLTAFGAEPLISGTKPSAQAKPFVDDIRALPGIAERHAQTLMKRCQEVSKQQLAQKTQNVSVLKLINVEHFLTHPQYLQEFAKVFQERKRSRAQLTHVPPILILITRKSDGAKMLFAFSTHIQEEDAPWHRSNSLMGSLINMQRGMPDELECDGLHPGLIRLQSESSTIDDLERYARLVLASYRDRQRQEEQEVVGNNYEEKTSEARRKEEEEQEEEVVAPEDDIDDVEEEEEQLLREGDILTEEPQEYEDDDGRG
eukprot:GHVS01061955.1.p1 GENE.GHVS01061955.1~~GHVS01061955.1.p1  ORF type:complete len:692 (+),score=137.57 GHVS01061955.1:125-2077(+)